MSFSLEAKRIWVAGHRGMVGSAILRRLQQEHCEILTAPRARVDLRRQAEVEAWLSDAAPDVVVVAAAKVGGILANASFPADFLYDNLLIASNVIHASHVVGVQKLLFLGSSCIYPKLANQPIVEDALLTGPLEPTNEWYAIAKIAGLKLCEAFRHQYGSDFISAMPTNLYGPGDNFDLRTSHVLPALIRKVHAARVAGARSVEIWGSGKVRREFMHVDDLADACVFLLGAYSGAQHINVGSGEDITIQELAETISDVIGYDGTFHYDRSKPDGTPRKLMDNTKLTQMGWTPRIELRAGIRSAYDWFLQNREALLSGEPAEASATRF